MTSYPVGSINYDVITTVAFPPPALPDDDNDGYIICDDCNDNDDSVHPGASEVCDGKDNNCNSETDEGLSTDADTDGHYTTSSCKTPHDDCNDGDASVYPGASEICDSMDNNCDGQIDEGLSIDADGDGHFTAGSCNTPHDDCNDSDPAVYPGNPEICDSKDNDCNDLVDENLSTDADGDGYFTLDSCRTPHNDCDDGNAAIYPGAVEICDGTDNNCNGETDEGLSTDADGDGHFTVGSCDTPHDDCNDIDPTIYPEALEICDGKDNDCDGIIDTQCCQDGDGDGVNACEDCNDNDPLNTDTIWDNDDDGYSGCNDCNNSDPMVHPDATELCDNKDNDCDLQIDEGGVCCADNDGDGYFNVDASCLLGSDCNDGDSQIYPGNSEICDGKDNNCNGVTDEGTGPCCGNPCCDDQCCGSGTSNDTGDGEAYTGQ